MRRAHDEEELAQLLARCQKGDARAWQALVDRFQAYVYSVPRRIGLGEDDAADVFQTTFVALYRSLDRLDSAAALPKWLAVTASREALRLKRLRARLPIVSASDGDDRSLDEILADEELNAEHQALAACDAETIRRAVLALHERCAKLLSALYFAPDPSYQAISDEIGIPIGAIGPTRARCLEKLRKNLMEAGFFE